MKFTRRHARAAAAGAATAALWLAGGKVADSKTLRGSALLILAAASIVGAQAAERTSSLSKTTKKRLDQHVADTAAAVHFVAHGGTVSGSITCSGLNTSGGSISTSGGNATVNTLTTGSGGISMGGSLIMNLNQAFTFSHITANQIGPGGDRAALGAGATLAQVQARCDFLLAQLENAGICY